MKWPAPANPASVGESRPNYIGNIHHGRGAAPGNEGAGTHFATMSPHPPTEPSGFGGSY